MSGNDVSELQTFLALDKNVYPEGLVTGYFGSLTKTAVSRFQTKNGISSIGRVGPVTLAAIYNQGGFSGTDTNSPTINSLGVSPSGNSVNLSWNTSEDASAIIYYSTSPIQMIESGPSTSVTIGGTGLLVHIDLRASHSATISNLQRSTLYYYVVYARDGSGNESIVWPATFQTGN
ncbi:MAG: peptidoglycan-binding protein [bacterium]